MRILDKSEKHETSSRCGKWQEDNAGLRHNGGLANAKLFGITNKQTIEETTRETRPLKSASEFSVESKEAKQ